MTKTKNKLVSKYEALLNLQKNFFGYPCNRVFNHQDLIPFLEFPLNNVGDPFGYSNFQLNTHDFECEVLAYMANLYGASDNYWGYVSSGGTEGNILGTHLGRLHYPEAVVYYSQHSHYSVFKAAELTRALHEEIPVQDNGEIDYLALKSSLLKNKHLPAIIIANIGTTMTGAIDNIFTIKSCLKFWNLMEFIRIKKSHAETQEFLLVKSFITS